MSEDNQSSIGDYYQTALYIQNILTVGRQPILDRGLLLTNLWEHTGAGATSEDNQSSIGDYYCGPQALMYSITIRRKTTNPR